jgi:hypothetical protein
MNEQLAASSQQNARPNLNGQASDPRTRQTVDAYEPAPSAVTKTATDKNISLESGFDTHKPRVTTLLYSNSKP